MCYPLPMSTELTPKTWHRRHVSCRGFWKLARRGATSLTNCYPTEISSKDRVGFPEGFKGSVNAVCKYQQTPWLLYSPTISCPLEEPISLSFNSTSICFSLSPHSHATIYHSRLISTALTEPPSYLRPPLRVAPFNMTLLRAAFRIMVLDLVLDNLLGIEPDSFSDLLVALCALFITTIFGTPMHVLSGYLVGLEVTRQTHFMKASEWNLQAADDTIFLYGYTVKLSLCFRLGNWIQESCGQLLRACVE